LADPEAVSDTVENLILDLVEWVERKERTYRETTGCLAHILPEAPCLGGCSGAWIRGDDFCKRRFGGQGHTSRPRFPQGKKAALL
jgi:hypothetical protein